MRFAFIRKGTLFLGIFILAAVLVMAILYAGGLIKSAEHPSAFTAAYGQDETQVRNTLLLQAMDVLGACEPKQAAEVWAQGVKQRNAAMQYAVMCQSLRKTYLQTLEQTAPYWVTGVSSPWVASYTVEDVTPASEETYTVRLIFSLATSTGPAGNYSARLDIAREGEFFCIQKINPDKGLRAYTGLGN